MSIFRRYAEFPAMFTPAKGEVVLAARSAAGPFVRAVVINVRRASRDKIRITFQWIEDGDTPYMNGVPIREGERGHCYVAQDDRIPLIRRLPRKSPTE